MAARDEEAVHASALRIISIRPHSVFELKRKLLTKGADRAVVERVVERLVGVDLVNDKRFARDFLEYAFLRKSWGIRKVRAALAERGIDRGLVEGLLGTPESAEMEREGALRFARKETRDGDVSDEKKRKVMSKLAARGFGWDLVKQVIDDLQEPA